MPSRCEFQVTFHSRFRVGGPYGIDGVDLSVDPQNPLPADHLKGVMRAAADSLAGSGFVPASLVEDVFGTVRNPCPWTWLSAEADDGAYDVTNRNRVCIHAATHAAAKDMLVTGAQAWTATATFAVRQLDPVDEVERHLAILRLSARHTHHIGSWRRRGLGWVTIAPTADAPSAAEDLDLVAAQAGGAA
ncbi:MAG: hypothetical protein V9G19_10385 [Tetrasphaera sp.]